MSVTEENKAKCWNYDGILLVTFSKKRRWEKNITIENICESASREETKCQPPLSYTNTYSTYAILKSLIREWKLRNWKAEI